MVRKSLEEWQRCLDDLFVLNGYRAVYRMPLAKPVRSDPHHPPQHEQDVMGILELDGCSASIRCNTTLYSVPRRHWYRVNVEYGGNPYLQTA